MHYELWEYRTRSLIRAYDSEAEALATVRELLATGWTADELSLGMEDEDKRVGELSPPLEGPALANRARFAAKTRPAAERWRTAPGR